MTGAPISPQGVVLAKRTWQIMYRGQNGQLGVSEIIRAEDYTLREGMAEFWELDQEQTPVLILAVAIACIRDIRIVR